VARLALAARDRPEGPVALRRRARRRILGAHVARPDLGSHAAPAAREGADPWTPPSQPAATPLQLRADPRRARPPRPCPRLRVRLVSSWSARPEVRDAEDVRAMDDLET